VNEQVVPILTRDESIALVAIEPLNSTLSHFVPFFLCPAGQTLRRSAIPCDRSATRDILPQSERLQTANLYSSVAGERLDQYGILVLDANNGAQEHDPPGAREANRFCQHLVVAMGKRLSC
jgi:hypothetical protein